MSNHYAQAREHFERATRDHQMEVLHDDDLYRHLRFKAPDTFMYGYDLVTWPGYLAINGDLDSGYTFSRIPDMVRFFASGPDVNPGYWAEKITNRDAMRGTRVYNAECVRRRVEEQARYLADTTDLHFPEIMDAWADQSLGRLDSEQEAHGALRDFAFGGYGFGPDTWEWDLRDWDHHFLLCCFAIRAGVEQYRAYKGAQ